MSREAMKLALEALETERENYQDWDKQDGAPEYIYEAITALREALAEQPAQQEPVASDFEKWLGQPSYHDGFGRSPDLWSLKQIQAAVAAMLTAAPQPAQQEPYGYVSTHTNGLMHFNKTFQGVYRDTATEIVAVYTSPPAQRKPQGYAGITIWGGDVTITRIFTELEIKRARFPNELIKQAVRQCLDELAAHGITGENT